MRKIYLIRHEKPDFGAKKVFIGSTDTPLGKEGRANLAKLKERFSGVDISAVFSSPLRRAIETAKAIGEPVVLDGLREINLGAWEGLTKDEAREGWPQVFKERGERPDLIPAPGGETFAQVYLRSRMALFKAASDSTGNIAVVAHSMVNRLILSSILNIPWKDALCIQQQYGCVNVLSLSPSDWGAFRIEDNF